jgi:hypothetical protein
MPLFFDLEVVNFSLQNLHVEGAGTSLVVDNKAQLGSLEVTGGSQLLGALEVGTPYPEAISDGDIRGTGGISMRLAGAPARQVAFGGSEFLFDLTGGGSTGFLRTGQVVIGDGTFRGAPAYGNLPGCLQVQGMLIAEGDGLGFSSARSLYVSSNRALPANHIVAGLPAGNLDVEASIQAGGQVRSSTLKVGVPTTPGSLADGQIQATGAVTSSVSFQAASAGSSSTMDTDSLVITNPGGTTTVSSTGLVTTGDVYAFTGDVSALDVNVTGAYKVDSKETKTTSILWSGDVWAEPAGPSPGTPHVTEYDTLNTVTASHSIDGGVSTLSITIASGLTIYSYWVVATLWKQSSWSGSIAYKAYLPVVVLNSGGLIKVQFFFEGGASPALFTAGEGCAVMVAAYRIG